MQDILGKQNFLEDLKNVYEPFTNTIKDSSRDITNTMAQTSMENNKRIPNLNGQVLELMNDKRLIAQYIISSVVKLFKPENISQLKLKKDPNSNRMNDFLIQKIIPVTLYSNNLTFRDSNNFFNIDGDLLKTITNYDFKVIHSKPQEQKLIYEFGKEIKFDKKHIGRKSNKDTSLKTLPKPPAIIASGISTTFLPESPNELCDVLKFSIREKQAGNNSDLKIEENFAIVDKLLEYKSIFTKQSKILLVKCLNWLKSTKLLEVFQNVIILGIHHQKWLQ